MYKFYDNFLHKRALSYYNILKSMDRHISTITYYDFNAKKLIGKDNKIQTK